MRFKRWDVRSQFAALLCVLPAAGRQWEMKQAKQFTEKTTQWAWPLTRLACFVACQFGPPCPWHLPENKRPRMASSRLNVDSPRLTIYLEFAPDSRRWWINTVGSVRGAAICTPRLEDTTNAIIMPLMQHPSAGWWIPLIKDLWCCIVVFSMYSFSATNIILT